MPRNRNALSLMLSVLLLVVASCRNRPPAFAQAPDGPTNCYPNRPYTFTVAATDPNGDNVAIRFDWGDSVVSDWTEWEGSGVEVALSHTWADTGTFEVRAQAQDKKLLGSEWSPALPVQVLPRPETPAVPIGPTLCFKDTVYTFKSVTTDRFGDSVSIRFDWGSDTSDWSPFIASGETVAMSYAWPDVGHNEVTAQARDQKLHTTEWSDGLGVDVILRLGPDKPTVPSGPYRGGQDSIYDFSSSATHPQGIHVAIRFDWGNGDTSDWSVFMAPGEPITRGYAWSVPDTYGVKAQAKDTGGTLSEWSDPRTILVRPADTLEIWRFQIKAGAAENNHSSPAIAPDGTIYVGSQDNYVYAVNNDGTLKWRFQTGGPVRSSPAIAPDGTIYVGSHDNRLYALDTGGAVKWFYITGGDIPSSPAIAADGTIYFGSKDGYVYALNPDSTLKWRYSVSQDVYSSPAIAPDGTIYVGSNSDYLYAFAPDGTLKWRHATSRDVQSSPAIAADGTIYFGSLEGILYALSPNDTVKWSFQTNGQIYASPVIAPDGTVYFGSTDNVLYAMNPDGTMKWRHVTGDNIYSSAAINADGTIYFGSNDNNLYALRPDSALVWWYPTDNDITSSPTIGTDGKIYFVGDDGYLHKLKGFSQLSNSNWPKFRHDIKNTGRVGAK